MSNLIEVYPVNRLLNDFVRTLHRDVIPVDSLCHMLCQCFDLKAASHLSITTTGDLVLRAQEGLSYDLYQDFELDRDTPAGMALDSPDPLFFPDVNVLENYRDKELISNFELRSLLTFRIDNPEIHDVKQRTLGVICMYPKEDADIEQLKSYSKEIMNAVSHFVAASLKSSCHSLRGDIVDRAAFSTDLNSFLHRSLRTLAERWNIGAASVYFHDDDSKVLRLRATTGLREKRRRADVFIRDDDTQNAIVDAFRNNRTIEHKKVGANIRSSILEEVDGEVRTIVDLPIYEPIGPKEIRPVAIGVLRVINKTVANGHSARQMSFSWDDIFILKYACQLFGVIGNLHRKIDSSIENLNRTFHGIGNNIHGIEANLSVLKDQNVMHHVRDHYAFLLEDSLAFVESLNAQIDRFEVRAKYQDGITSLKHEVGLGSEVLGPLPRYARAVARLLEVRDIRFDISAFAGDRMKEIPRVVGDPDYYLIVFKNLVENSIKYCGGKSCSIKLTWEANQDDVVIYFADKGLGIDKEDRDVIFREGVRGSRASEASALGAGMGLFHCVELLEQFDAHLTLLVSPPAVLKEFKTCFELRFPTWESHRG